MTDNVSPTWILTGSEVSEEQMAAFQAKHVEIIKMSSPNIRIEEVLQLLGEKGITSLYVEGGQAVHASFLQSGFVNSMITYIAPKVVGGTEAPSMFADLHVLNMNESFGFVFQSVEKIGDDLKITSTLK